MRAASDLLPRNGPERFEGRSRERRWPSGR